VQFSQEIKGQQEPVFITTSMAIQGTSLEEGFDLPPAVLFSGNLTVDVQVGRLSSVEYFANFIQNQISSDTSVSSDQILAEIMSKISLLKYGRNSSSEEFTNLLLTLVPYTDPSYGLQIFPSQDYKYTRTPSLWYLCFKKYP